MKKCTLLFISLFVGFFYSSDCLAQVDSIILLKCDTLSQNQFDNLLVKQLKIMKRKEEVSTEQIISIVKIFQTLSFSFQNEYKRNKKYRKFVSFYKRTYSFKAADKLGIIFLKGLTGYSKKYDLYLSESKFPLRCHNYYTLIGQ